MKYLSTKGNKLWIHKTLWLNHKDTQKEVRGLHVRVHVRARTHTRTHLFEDKKSVSFGWEERGLPGEYHKGLFFIKYLLIGVWVTQITFVQTLSSYIFKICAFHYFYLYLVFFFLNIENYITGNDINSCGRQGLRGKQE